MCGIPEAAGRYGDLQIQFSTTSALALWLQLGFLIQICSIVAPIRVVAFSPPLPAPGCLLQVDYAAAADAGFR